MHGSRAAASFIFVKRCDFSILEVAVPSMTDIFIAGYVLNA
jgi:hypothetical protein